MRSRRLRRAAGLGTTPALQKAMLEYVYFARKLLIRRRKMLQLTYNIIYGPGRLGAPLRDRHRPAPKIVREGRTSAPTPAAGAWRSSSMGRPYPGSAPATP